VFTCLLTDKQMDARTKRQTNTQVEKTMPSPVSQYPSSGAPRQNFAMIYTWGKPESWHYQAMTNFLMMYSAVLTQYESVMDEVKPDLV